VYLIEAWIKCFNSIMVETGNTINLILGSVGKVIGAREVFAKVASDGSMEPTADSVLSPGEIWGISRPLENLNNIKLNGWANSEIVHIIREQNTEIAGTLNSRKSYIQLSMFPKPRAIVNYGSLERHPLESVPSSCEN
jgi:hypothetical protein